MRIRNRQKRRKSQLFCSFDGRPWTFPEGIGKKGLVPAEGLLGYASSLRDRRREGSGVQLGPTAKLSNPSCFMSGVRPTCR